MANKALPLRLGPFVGGLNTYSDASSILDDECAYLNNFDIKLDGMLVNRPSIMKTVGVSNWDTRIIGTFVDNNGHFCLIVTHINAIVPYTSEYDTVTMASTTISSTLYATSTAKYNGKIYIVADTASVGNGGVWDGVSFTSLPGLPRGVSCCMYKERMFIASGIGATSTGKISFCQAPLDPSGGPEGTWLGTDFFFVNNGDGQGIIKLYTYNNSIAIFKSKSTYIFAYESAPTKGQVQVMSSAIGIDNADCLAEDQNILYIMFNAKVYSIASWNWTHLNTKVPFSYSNNHVGGTKRNYSLSIIGERLICRYYDNLYVYGFISKVWTLWTTPIDYAPDFWVSYPIANTGTGIKMYWAGNYLSVNTPGSNVMYTLQDGVTTDAEPMTCEVRTKIVDEVVFGARTRVFVVPLPYAYKRLYYWGAEMQSSAPVQASIIPVIYTTPVKWSDLTSRHLTWADMSTHTWIAPLSVTLRVDDSANVRNTTNSRVFVKYRHPVRFRQIQFILKTVLNVVTPSAARWIDLKMQDKLWSDMATRTWALPLPLVVVSTPVTGPVKIFKVEAFIASKGHVSQQIN